MVDFNKSFCLFLMVKKNEKWAAVDKVSFLNGSRR